MEDQQAWVTERMKEVREEQQQQQPEAPQQAQERTPESQPSSQSDREAAAKEEMLAASDRAAEERIKDLAERFSKTAHEVTAEHQPQREQQQEL